MIRSRAWSLWLLQMALASIACGGAAQERPTGPNAPGASSTAQTKLSSAIDERAVAAATGVEKAETSPDGVVKASFPRKDVDVAVDGWKMPSFMGLTSWVAFSPARAGLAEAMVMGDLVLFEDEVNPVMSVLLGGGVSVTALHNHFFYDAPKVFFMHVGGEGSVGAIGRTVRAAMDKVAEIRKAAPRPASSSGAPSIPPQSSIDATKLDAILAVKGQAKDGMYKAVVGRRSTAASCGCAIGKAMGVNTWAAFAGSDEVAVVDGDFAVSEAELQGVLKSLRAGGIHVVAIHHHMTGETPRVLFLHYWGRGRAADLAATVRRTLELTDFDKST